MTDLTHSVIYEAIIKSLMFFIFIHRVLSRALLSIWSHPITSTNSDSWNVDMTVAERMKLQLQAVCEVIQKYFQQELHQEK